MRPDVARFALGTVRFGPDDSRARWHHAAALRPRRRPFRSPTTTSGPRSPTATAGSKTRRARRRRAFIDAENAYTARYLKQARIRPQVSDDLDALEHVSTLDRAHPARRTIYYFEKRLAGEEQSSIYVRHGWTGKDERLIDPAQFSRDPNTSVDLADVSRDGSLLAYRVRAGRRRRDHGARLQCEDRQDARRRAAQRPLPERGLHAGRARASTTRATTQQGIAALPHVLGTRVARGHADLRPRVSRRAAWPERPVLGGGDRRRPLPGGRDRPRRAGQARRHRLSAT